MNMAEPAAADPASWRAPETGRRVLEWRLSLAPRQQDEIVAAVDRSTADGIGLSGLTRETFPLPATAPLLRRVADDVVRGRGFAVIRGLPIARLDAEGIARAWLGLGAHLGVPRPQNGAGHLLGHVYDLGDDRGNPATRLYRTNARQRFHIDSCDVVGLLCLRPAKRGGASSLCSSVAIVEEIGRRRPELLRVLQQPFVYDRKGEVPAGKGPYYEIPIVHRFEGRLSVFFARDFIEAAQKRFAEVPRLTALQVEALDLVEQLAEDDEFRLDMTFEPGDMQFVHNHVALHSRTAFEDWDDPARKRHLLRLWLSPHDPRSLPPVFAERYGPLEPGRPRGGIEVPGVVPVVPLSPV
jgi:hypothetical protein